VRATKFTDEERIAFIREGTALAAVPLVPEIRIYTVVQPLFVKRYLAR